MINNYLVFDIETIGKKYEELDETTRKYFEQWAEKYSQTKEEAEKELDKLKKGLPLSPFQGEIVAIGMSDQDNEGACYFRNDGDVEKPMSDFDEGGIKYRVGAEKEILERFWGVVQNFDTFVTFNGRGFDCPFLIIRSAVYGIRPSANLMPNRYLGLQKYGPRHIDLSDQMTFYGAYRPSPKLHFVTTAFGITSSKEGEISGEEVPRAFYGGKYKEIAQYCMGDVFATKELFEKWKNHMNFEM